MCLVIVIRRKFIKISYCFMSAYRIGLTGKAAELVRFRRGNWSCLGVLSTSLTLRRMHHFLMSHDYFTVHYGKPNSRAHFPDSRAQLGYTTDNKMLLKDFEHRVRLSVSHHAPYVNLIRLACVRTQHSGVSGAKRCPKLPAALLNSLRLFGCETELGKLHHSRFCTLPKCSCSQWATVNSSITWFQCLLL